MQTCNISFLLQMNVISHLPWFANVPKSHSPDYSTRIMFKCSCLPAVQEHILEQECAQILDLYWSIHIQDTELFSLMKQSWLTSHPQWKCHHRRKTLWLKLHSFLSYSIGGSILASGSTWWWTWVPKLFRYCDRVCGLPLLEVGMWIPTRAPSPTASISTYGYSSWPSPFCCTW